jgi:hypothetical protein
MFTWINVQRHLAAQQVRERWGHLRDGRDRGSISVEFAVTAGLIVLGAVVIVGLIMAYGEEIANQIGSE